MFDTTIDKPRTFQLLQKRGIVKMLVSFSGGNDEGGADGFQAFDSNGQEVEFAGSGAYNQPVWDEATQSWSEAQWVIWDRPTARAATPQEIEDAQLVALLESPVYAEYGGFAGDFSVSGTVTWDVSAGTVHMDRSEQVWTDTDGIDF